MTPEVEAAVAEAVELGATWEKAADSAGIGGSTLREWKQRGEAGEAPFAAFLATLKRAEGAGIARSLRNIRQAADSGSWQAAAWLLERRYPADYGRRSEIRVDSDAAADMGSANVAAALRRIADQQANRATVALLDRLADPEDVAEN